MTAMPNRKRFSFLADPSTPEAIGRVLTVLASTTVELHRVTERCRRAEKERTELVRANRVLRDRIEELDRERREAWFC